ncbi:helix-turn-helix domain-containing protein [Mycobacterium intracellulare]|uniref:helix-turn-helix domain-containing protein n=1 Tax=Mycobacterium intracellulare TaxID=1767 RepID=UPI001CD94D8B|nr:helix-turn-helix domain-containing protein [Mycobacterium intracellulare]MCA2249023.1 helix-turn-helix domain-containing protein [Mycobacterium intracellulare]
MADIARLAGVIVSEEAALELVAALDQLDKLAAPRALRLNSRLAAIRRELQTCVSRVGARVDTSTNHVAAHPIAQFEGSVIDTTTAADVLGITRDGVTWLCRNGTLRATLRGRRWFVEVASLHDYRARRADR